MSTSEMYMIFSESDDELSHNLLNLGGKTSTKKKNSSPPPLFPNITDQIEITINKISHKISAEVQNYDVEPKSWDEDNYYVYYYDDDKNKYFTIYEEKNIFLKIDKDGKFSSDSTYLNDEKFTAFLNILNANKAAIHKAKDHAQPKQYQNHLEQEASSSHNPTQDKTSYLRIVVVLTVAVVAACVSFILLQQVLAMVFAALAALAIGTVAGFIANSFFASDESSKSSAKNNKANNFEYPDVYGEIPYEGQSIFNTPPKNKK
jgi:hypothetical protein